MLTDVVYRLYERRLQHALRTEALPRHIGVVLDGNRRYARAHRLSTVAEGHRIGASKIDELLDWCHELSIPYVSLWLLSTAHHRGCHVQVAIGYGGRQEITDALRALLAERRAQGHSLEDVIDDLTPELIAEHLYTTGTPDPDLIIRTSGEIRLSGFLLWQSVHSEFYFCDPYWPEFRKTDFLRALRDFAHRQRRYGR